MGTYMEEMQRTDHLERKLKRGNGLGVGRDRRRKMVSERGRRRKTDLGELGN